MNTEIIRTNGTREPLESTRDTRAIAKAIGADVLDTVNLRNGFTMWVNDNGMGLDLPVNRDATTLYSSVCRPGTTHQIRGDVAITRSW